MSKGKLCQEVNPFSSRYVRPGAIPFFFPEGGSLEDLIRPLEATEWRGQILGPHGSGKSALLAALIPAIHQHGRLPALYELHEGDRRLPEHFPPHCPPQRPVVVLVDGYEQLSRWGRLRLRRWCRQNKAGLIVTSHRSVGLPLLIRLQPSLELAQKIVQWLLRHSPVSIHAEEVAWAYQYQRGNLREMLFMLYDIWEQKFRHLL